jgi:thioredoxin reductase (NADPH)
MSENQYDIIVIGAGPAGLTAGMYGAWVGMKTLILETSNVGGRAWLAPKIENYPGIEGIIKGSELTDKCGIKPNSSGKNKF